MEHQIIDEVVLSRQDDGEQRFGIHVELTDGMELGQDFQSHKRGLVDDQDGGLFSLGDFDNDRFKGAYQPGQRVGLAVHVEAAAYLFQDVGHGSGSGYDGDDPVLRGMELSGGMAQGGGFAAAHIAGDDGDGAQTKGVEAAFRDSLKPRQGIEILQLDILGEGFSLKPEEGFIIHGPPPRRVFRPYIFRVPEREGWILAGG